MQIIYRKIKPLLALLVTIIAISILFPKLQNPTNLQSLIIDMGWKGIVLDLIILSLQMVLPFIPFSLLAGMNIILFGWFWGFLLSLSASVIGSAFGFWLARTLGQDWAMKKMTNYHQNWMTISNNKSFAVIMLARLIPILPSAAVNYASGLSSVTFTVFITATIFGKIPMIAWESWIGHDFWQILNHPLRFLTALIIGLIFVGASMLIWRHSANLKKNI